MGTRCANPLAEESSHSEAHHLDCCPRQTRQRKSSVTSPLSGYLSGARLLSMRLGDNSVPSLGEGTSLVNEVRQGRDALRRAQDNLSRNVTRDLAQDIAVRRVASAVLEYVRARLEVRAARALGLLRGHKAAVVLANEGMAKTRLGDEAIESVREVVEV